MKCMCSVITTVMEMPVHCSDWCRETQHALYIYTNVAVYSHKYQEHMFCKNHMVVTSLRDVSGMELSISNECSMSFHEAFKILKVHLF